MMKFTVLYAKSMKIAPEDILNTQNKTNLHKFVFQIGYYLEIQNPLY